MTTVAKDQFYHGGIMWRYNDARGVPHLGHFVRSSDFGGTDVRYQFQDCETGELSALGGMTLKGAHAVSDCCATRKQLLADCS